MQRAIELGQKGVVPLVVQAAAPERPLDAGVGEFDVACVFVRVEITARPG